MKSESWIWHGMSKACQDLLFVWTRLKKTSRPKLSDRMLESKDGQDQVLWQSDTYIKSKGCRKSVQRTRKSDLPATTRHRQGRKQECPSGERWKDLHLENPQLPNQPRVRHKDMTWSVSTALVPWTRCKWLEVCWVTPDCTGPLRQIRIKFRERAVVIVDFLHRFLLTCFIVDAKSAKFQIVPLKFVFRAKIFAK